MNEELFSYKTLIIWSILPIVNLFVVIYLCAVNLLRMMKEKVIYPLEAMISFCLPVSLSIAGLLFAFNPIVTMTQKITNSFFGNFVNIIIYYVLSTVLCLIIVFIHNVNLRLRLDKRDYQEFLGISQGRFAKNGNEQQAKED